jgi:hypothetical protein
MKVICTSVLFPLVDAPGGHSSTCSLAGDGTFPTSHTYMLVVDRHIHHFPIPPPKAVGLIISWSSTSKMAIIDLGLDDRLPL